MRLQKRASLYSGLGLLFMVSILAFIGVWTVGETTERSLNERVAIAQMVARGVDQALLTARDELERLSLMVSLGDEDPIPEQHLLSNLQAFSGTFSHVFLLDSDKNILNSHPLLISEEVKGIVARDPGVSQALATRSAAINSIAMNSEGSKLMFSISVPIYEKAGKSPEWPADI